MTSLSTDTNCKTISGSLDDVTRTDTGLYLSNVILRNVILLNTGTCVYNVEQIVSSARQWYYVIVLGIMLDTGIQQFQCC
jgi:hypothetical protein